MAVRLSALRPVHITRARATAYTHYGSSRTETWWATEVVWTKIYEDKEKPAESPDEHKPGEHEHE
jgi:hypothetical protein